MTDKSDLLISNWDEDSLELLGKIPDSSLARMLNTNTATIKNKRIKAGIPKAKKESYQDIPWTEEMISNLGKDTDINIAKKFKIGVSIARDKRRSLKITPFKPRKKSSIEAIFSNHQHKWERISKLPQLEFFDYILSELNPEPKNKATSKTIANICLYDEETIEKWASPFSKHEILPIADRHHIWLATLFAKALKTNALNN